MRPVSARRSLVSSLVVLGLTLVLLGLQTTAALAYDPEGAWNSPVGWGFGTFGGLWPLDDTTAQNAVFAGSGKWQSGVSQLNLYYGGTTDGPVVVESCYLPGCVAGTLPNTPGVTIACFQNELMTCQATVFINTGTDAGGGHNITWSTTCPTPVGDQDLNYTVTHEFGHAVGLGDLYPQNNFDPWMPPDTVMGSNDLCAPNIGQDDFDGVQALYGWRYYLAGVYANYNGRDSILTIMGNYPFHGQTARVTFYSGNYYNPGSNIVVTVAGPTNPNAPVSIDAAQHVPPGYYTVTVDTPWPGSVVDKVYQSGQLVADDSARVVPFALDGENTPTGAQMVPEVNFTGPQGACPNGRMTSTYVPLVQNNNHGWTTTLDIMDVGSQTCALNNGNGQSAHIVYYNQSGGQIDGGYVPLGEDHGVQVVTTGAPTIGSAVITTPDNLVVTVEQNNGNPATSALFFTGFSMPGTLGGSPGAANYFPLLQINNHGWQSGIAVQNLSPSATTMTLSVNGYRITSPSIPAWANWVLFPIPLPGSVGTGFVQADNNTPVAAIANQITSTTPQGSSYSAFTNQPNLPTLVYFPALANGVSEGGTTWTSGMVVMNTSTQISCASLWENNTWTNTVCLNINQSYTYFPVPQSGMGSQWSTLVGWSDRLGGVGMLNWLSTSDSAHDLFFTYPGGI